MTKTRTVEVCKCENCGNEAEMIITCEMVEVERAGGNEGQATEEKNKTVTCTNCGNEADMIIEE